MAQGPNYEREIDLDLVDWVDEDHTGHLKTDQKPSEQHHEVSKIGISVRRLVEAHGLYDTVKNKPASLVVLRFKITSKDADQHRRVKGLVMKLRFEKVPRGDNWHDPFLGSFAPGLKGDVYLRPTKEKRVEGKESGVEASLDAPHPIPGHVGIHRNWTTSREFDQDFISKISGDSKKTLVSKGKRQGDDEIWWNITENASQEDGIADTFAVAVLVKREESEKFQVHLSLDVKVDVKYKLAEFWTKITSKRHEPLGFDPATPPDEDDGFPQGYSRNNLKEFADKNLLDGLAFFHFPEQLKTANFYQDT